MRTRRPFPDVEEHDQEELGVVVVDPADFSQFFPEHEADTAVSEPLFTPASGENRKARRGAVATWTPPKQEENEPRVPTRRELLAQRQRIRLGTTNTALRRLQRDRIRKVKR